MAANQERTLTSAFLWADITNQSEQCGGVRPPPPPPPPPPPLPGGGALRLMLIFRENEDQKPARHQVQEQGNGHWQLHSWRFLLPNVHCVDH